MKLSFLIILSIMSSAKVLAQSDRASNHLETEVLKTIKQWNRAFENNDPDKYFTFIHEDLSLYISSSPYRIDGRANDREEFEWSLKDGRTHVNLFQELQPSVTMLGSTSALVTYHTRGIYGPIGNESIVYLKETNVLIKENGEWKIIHIHVSK